MEENNILIFSIKEKIKLLKFEIIEKMDKLDELLDSIETKDEVDF